MLTVNDVKHRMASLRARTDLGTVLEWPGLPDVVVLRDQWACCGSPDLDTHRSYCQVPWVLDRRVEREQLDSRVRTE